MRGINLPDEQPALLKASDINAMDGFEFHLRHPFNQHFVYLSSGEAGRLDAAVFPQLGNRVIGDNESA